MKIDVGHNVYCPPTQNLHAFADFHFT